MPIRVKTGTSTWSSIKKVYAKVNTGSSGWKAATRIFAKLATGWIQVWPGDAPASSLTDPIDIRLTGYNGARATSPQYINTVLYGNDGTITGAAPITVNSRRMKISEDNSGNTTRYQLETTDVYNLTSNSETDIGFKRYMADGWWLFYELVASNSDSPYPPGTTLYSPPIKIIRQAPTFTSGSPTLSENYVGTDPLLSINFSFSDTWWKAADLSRSYIKWWQNTSKSPGGTALQTTYIANISGTSDTRSGSYSEYNGTGTTVSGVDSYTPSGGIPAGQYVIAEIVLINSYTDHTGSPVSAFVSTGNKPSITALSVADDNGNSVVDNQSPSRIISDGYLNFTATVADAAASTYYLLEPRMYNWVNGNTYQFNTSTVISETSFPTDLTPTSVSLNGTTATVTWRIKIDAPTIYNIGTPTYSGGQPRWQFEFRVSARASSSSTNSSASYFSGIASLGGDTTYLQGLDLPAMVAVHPSSAMTLNVSSTTPALGSAVTFSGTTVGYPTSTYSSFPRRYIIEYGDGTDSGWQYFSTGTSNPSFSGITKTYSQSGTYTATLKWEPQGDPSRSTRSRTIVVGSSKLSTPTSVSASDNRSDGVQVSWTNVSNAATYGVWYGPVPGYDANPDFGGPNNNGGKTITSSPFLDDIVSGGTTRDYYVQAFPTAGSTTYSKSDWSTGDSGTRLASTVPTAPTNLFTSNVTSSGATINWSAPTSNGGSAITRYEVNRDSFGFFDVGNVTQYFYTLSQGTYTIGVRAVNSVGAGPAATIQVTIASAKLSTPTGVNASDNRSDGVLISWNAVSGAAYYGIWWGPTPSYDNNPDFGGPNNNGGWNGVGTSFLDQAIGAGSSRDYYVQAFASGNPTGTKSDWGGPNNGTRINSVPATAPGTPGSITNGWTSGTAYPFSWSAPSAGTVSGGGAASISYYNLYVYEATNSSGSGYYQINSYTVYGTSFNYTSPNASLYYAFQVSATNTAGLTGGLSGFSAYK